MINYILGKLICLVSGIILVSSFMLMIFYTPVRDGEIRLSRATESASLLREGGTGIHHIKADSLSMALYTQGFAHAQDRLWQMEKTRRMAKGQLSEIFGDKALNVDRFSLSVGHYRVAKQTWEDPEALDGEARELLMAYADGVNDYLDGVGIMNQDRTGYILPPEFYTLGIQGKIAKWTPVDSLALMKVINFHLSANWNLDLLRDILASLEDGELKDMVNELTPFGAEFTHGLQSALDDDDMK